MGTVGEEARAPTLAITLPQRRSNEDEIKGSQNPEKRYQAAAAKSYSRPRHRFCIWKYPVRSAKMAENGAHPVDSDAMRAALLGIDNRYHGKHDPETDAIFRSLKGKCRWVIT